MDDEEVVEITAPENEPEDCQKTTASWLIRDTMSGRTVSCSNCGAFLEVTKGSVIRAIIKNKYCYNCGAEMIINDADIT